MWWKYNMPRCDWAVVGSSRHLIQVEPQQSPTPGAQTNGQNEFKS